MKIISLKHSKNPKAGTVVYARVQSRSKPNVAHIVTGSRRGDGITWRCSCADKLFNPRTKCDHIKAVEKRS